MLEVKTLISEMNNSLNQLINKLDKSRRKKSVSLKLSQKKCKQTNIKSKQRNNWANPKLSTDLSGPMTNGLTHIIEVLEEGKQNGAEEIYEEIITKNFPN